MAWNTCYLDLILSPAAFLLMILYNVHLYIRYTRNPMSTIMGVNNRARRAWVRSIMQENDKKNVLAVQTLRNSIMGSTLLATTTILLSSTVAAFLVSSYYLENKINVSMFGWKSPSSLAVKYMALLVGFLSAFLCYVQSVRYTNHVNFNINIPDNINNGGVTADYVADVLERAANFHTIGTRAFYMTVPMLLWVFGPIPLFVSTLVLVPFWYNLDSAMNPRSNFGAGSGEDHKHQEQRKAESMGKENGFCPDNSLHIMKHENNNHCPLPVCTML